MEVHSTFLINITNIFMKKIKIYTKVALNCQKIGRKENMKQKTIKRKNKKNKHKFKVNKLLLYIFHTLLIYFHLLYIN